MAHPLATRSFRPTRVPSPATLAALRSALSGLALSSHQLHAPSIGIQHRNASHQAQGRANGAKDGPGKRLGAKKTDGQYVVPGNILYKQRGTLWFPGDGCFMGRDHTIHAKVPGYVKYYHDPSYPTRKYIGVVFERGNTLPQPHNAVRRRMLGMLAYRMPQPTTITDSDSTIVNFAPMSTTNSSDTRTIQTSAVPPSLPYPQVATIKSRRENGEVIRSQLELKRGYQWRQANHDIGNSTMKSRAARNVSPYDPKDRWMAWRKRRARRERAIERKALKGNAGKGKGNKRGGGRRKR